jgi:hypothetical protein
VDPLAMDGFRMERSLLNAAQFMENRHWDSEPDAKNFLHNLMPFVQTNDESASEKAEELIAEAYEATNKIVRLSKINEALRIFPQCVHAYLLLAMEEADLAQRIAYFAKVWQWLKPLLSQEHFWNQMNTFGIEWKQDPTCNAELPFLKLFGTMEITVRRLIIGKIYSSLTARIIRALDFTLLAGCWKTIQMIYILGNLFSKTTKLIRQHLYNMLTLSGCFISKDHGRLQAMLSCGLLTI